MTGNWTRLTHAPVAAIRASGDRTQALRGVRVPTLVIHGEDDPLVTIDGGKATAAAIPGARFLALAGMGHDLPRRLWPTIVQAISELTNQADGEPRAARTAPSTPW
jgi:pimeloyl-ACP methyl ester carboxylesterase